MSRKGERGGEGGEEEGEVEGAGTFQAVLTKVINVSKIVYYANQAVALSAIQPIILILIPGVTYHSITVQKNSPVNLNDS